MIPAPAKHTLLRAAVAALLLAQALPGRAQDSNGERCAASGDCEEERLEVEVVEPGAGLDWVPIEDVPPALRDRSCQLCRGRYIDPKADLAGGKNPEQADIEATAARSELRGNQLRLEGGVEVTQGYRDLASDRADYDRISETGNVEGNIVLREPGLLLRGSRGEFYSRTGEAQLEDGVFVLHEKHMRGEARLLSRDAEALIRVEDGALTYCAPGDRDWYLRSRQMTLDLDKGVGVARGARLASELLKLLRALVGLLLFVDIGAIQHLQTSRAARLRPREALVVEEELRARGDARRVLRELAHDPRASRALRRQQNEVGRRLRALGDDRRRRGEEQNLGKCHYLIFCTINPDRGQLCFSISIKSDTNITTLARRAFWSLATP